MILREGIRRAGAAVLGAFAIALAGVAPACAYTRYSQAPPQLRTNSFAFGQAPVFLPDGRVVVSDNRDRDYDSQTYVANQDGSGKKCLTCELPSQNLVPAVRPQGDWIIFHSWMNHTITFGSPGYGGIGSELYAMRADGSHVTKLYADPAIQDGEGTDDYHAYWSPDGKRVVWAHFNGNFIDGGGQARWDVRVADFTVDAKGNPTLTNVRVVRPANGHWYETQWWAPDGSGFLYTESWGSAMNTELFFCKLTAAGCETRRLTDNTAWDEQAIFTPDMKDVIFMSSRDHPGFYNTWSQMAQALGLTTDADNFLVLPIFEAGFLQPVAEEHTDLYDLDLASGAVRRLTTDGDDGWIVPEFSWDPASRELWFTENRIPRGVAVPLPLDVAKQAADTVNYVLHPNLTLHPKHPTDTLLPVEQRTRILSFPGTCAPPAKLTFALRGRGVRRASATVTGVRGVVRRGRALKSIAIANPMKQSFSVRVTTVDGSGRRAATTYAYDGLGCYRR